MPNKKISQLPENLFVNPPDVFPMLSDGVTYKVSAQTLLAFTSNYVANLSSNWSNAFSVTSMLSTFWNSVFTNVNLTSADWSSVYSTTKQLSAYWNSVYTLVNTNSADWEAVHTLVNSASANWNNVYSAVAPNSADWTLAYTNVPRTNSVYTHVNTNSADWEASHTLVNSASASWNTAYTNLISNSAAYLSGVNLSLVAAASASWNNTNLLVQLGSPTWNAAYNNSVVVPTLSSDWSSAYTTVKATSSVWNAGSVVTSLSGNWNSVYSLVSSASAIWNTGGGGSTTTEITANIAAGGISIGTKIAAGTTMQQFVEKLIVTTYYPTFIDPTLTISTDLGSTIVESGTTGATFILTANRGGIVGSYLNSIWNPNTFQDFRAGSVNSYTINNQLSLNNEVTLSDLVIEDGTNTFTGSVNFAIGPQPIDSKGNDYSTPLASGDYSSSISIIGARKYFYGLNNAGNSSETIRNLSNSNLSPTNGTTFAISIPSGTTSVVIAYPNTLRDVTSIKESAFNVDVKDVFAKTTVNVEGALGYTSIPYKVYRFQPAEPFGSPVTYTVII